MKLYGCHPILCKDSSKTHIADMIKDLGLFPLIIMRRIHSWLLSHWCHTEIEDSSFYKFFSDDIITDSPIISDQLRSLR